MQTSKEAISNSEVVTEWEMDDVPEVRSKSPTLSIDSRLFFQSSWAFARMFDMFSQRKKFRAVLEYNPKHDKMVLKVIYDDE